MSPRESGAFVLQKAVGGSRWAWRIVTDTGKFLLAPMVDRWSGLSLTRFIAVFCCVVVWHEVFEHERALSWVDFWLIVVATGTAFGKLTFEAVLQRIGLRSSSSDSTQHIDVNIRERRDQGKEWGAEAT